SRLGWQRKIVGFLPASSGEQCLDDLAAGVPTIRPTSVEPVSETARTSGCSSSGAPMREPKPLTMLMTPLGMPASASVRTRLNVDRGVSCAGLITQALH